MAFLYERIVEEYGRRGIESAEVPRVIGGNLKYRIRPYQAEAFKRFMLWQEWLGKEHSPHLLFNMATGSGKTLIMAGLMLALYEQGHRNFLFFVNSKNIIRKTKDNFVNAATGKYLFADSININGVNVLVKEVRNFEESGLDGINIKFTTVQQLHYDLNNDKENAITLDDLASQKIVLLADEAHHLSASTASEKKSLGSWEGTVERILKTNTENILLEFTATVDYKNNQIKQKYEDKIIYRYDLAKFRTEKYSKEINLLRSHYGEKERIIQALILNMYRQELAADNGINLKPVILFKAQKTIAQSESNKKLFHQIINDLSVAEIINIRKSSTVPIVKKAFRFFNGKQLSASGLTERIKANFREENCISANNEEEKDTNQIRLNTLEDDDNPLRAIFAVQKLNEGWDVLNLFDIVRLYEGRDSQGNKPGATTISEAQLIGRGARYFPFTTDKHQDLYTRKFDKDTDNDLKILEELYYHTRDDSRYISEIKKALVETGIYEDPENSRLVDLILKEEFKETEMYKTGKVIYNQKIYPEKHLLVRDKYPTFADLKVAKEGFKYNLTSGGGSVEGAFEILTPEDQTMHLAPKNIPLNDIQPHVIRYALSTNRFYRFDNLEKCFVVDSTSKFIKSKKYLGCLDIKFMGTKKRINSITNRDYFLAIQELLARIETEIMKDTPEFKVSDLVHDYVHKVFKDKQIRVSNEDAKGQRPLVPDAEWYVFTDNFGTPEEKSFVELFAGYFDEMGKHYKDIYLIRNEREVKITNDKGQTFEPDYLLFCKPLRGRNLTYQIFIEPKGEGFIPKDKWKEDFLLEINAKKWAIKIDVGEYQIFGLPFYNSEHQQPFKDAFRKLLELHDEENGGTNNKAATKT